MKLVFFRFEIELLPMNSWYLGRKDSDCLLKGCIIPIMVVMTFIIQGCMTTPQQATDMLHQAVLKGHLKEAKKSIKKGAMVNHREKERGWTPLLFASEADDTEMVRLLIESGADVNAISEKDKISPLQRASAKGNVQMAKILLDHGAEIDHQDAKLRSTPLMWAAAFGHVDVARLLLEKDALINVRGNRGESALFLAVSAEESDMVALLLSYKAIKNRPDIYGMTPLGKAKELNNQTIINLLDN